jgi:hypothetical protein
LISFICVLGGGVDIFVWHCHNKTGSLFGKTKLAKCGCKILAVFDFNE